MKSGQIFALWAGILCTVLIIPQLWAVSLWLYDAVLYDQFGSDFDVLITGALFAILFMMALAMARMTWSTSIAMALIFLISKLPIF
jgi:hypothetical protein